MEDEARLLFEVEMNQGENMRIVKGISLPLGDTHFAEHLEKGPEFGGKGTYQFAKIQMALDLVEPSKRSLALDVGGHIGLWSRVLAHHFARVIAFEPLPALAPHFRYNTADCENVLLVEFAASDTDSELDIVTTADNSGNGHVAPAGGTGVLTYRASCIRIDSLNLRGVNLIKIDVEGWELAVLRGAMTTIQRDRPAIVVEQKPNNAERYGVKRLAAVELLRSWGYAVIWEKSGDFGLTWQGSAS
jgi:FkbM family methyltransferase